MKTIVQKCCWMVMVLCFVTMCGCGPAIEEVYSFADIQECTGFTTMDSSAAEVSVYSAPDTDEHLGELPVEEYFGCHYVSEGLEFEIHAYEFSNAQGAKDYFKNVTGKTSRIDTNYSGISGMGIYRLAVIDGEAAYKVTTSAEDIKEVNDLIGAVFTKTLDFSKG